MKNRLLVPFIAIFALYQAKAEVPIPQLLVWLTVDELRSDYLDALLPEMRQDGFNLLLKEGIYYKQCRSPLAQSDGLAAMALLHTGQTGSVSGISERFPTINDSGNSWKNNVSIFTDRSYIGYATPERLSPKALLTPSIADMLKMSSNGAARVFSFSIFPEEAIVASGHHGDAAYWISSNTGKWASSTYYKERFPWYLEKYNNGSEGLRAKLQTYKWRLLYPSKAYDRLPYASAKSAVSIDLSFSPVGAAGAVERFTHSAVVIDELAKVINTFIQYSDIGSRKTPDLLNICLSVGNMDINNSLLGTVDAYYRLDKAIAEIVKSINAKVGSKHVVYVISGTGSASNDGENLLSGTFFTDRVQALLNMYLIPKYGKGKWISEVSNKGEVYINLTTVKASKHKIEEIENDVASFLREFSGVNKVMSRHQMLNAQIPATLIDFAKGISKNNKANIFFNLLPSWEYATQRDPSGEHKRLRSNVHYPIASPLIISHPSIQAQTLAEPVNTSCISSAIAYILRIRPPNPLVDIPAAIMQE